MIITYLYATGGISYKLKVQNKSNKNGNFDYNNLFVVNEYNGFFCAVCTRKYVIRYLSQPIRPTITKYINELLITRV